MNDTKKCPYCAEEIQAEAVKCKHCGTWLDQSTAGFGPASVRPPRKLCRSANDRMIAGVCGGLGQFLNLDPTVVRVLWVVVGILTVIIPTVLVYLILALVIPLEE